MSMVKEVTFYAELRQCSSTHIYDSDSEREHIMQDLRRWARGEVDYWFEEKLVEEEQ